MFDSHVQNEPMFQFSVKLSAAIKKHTCLYDHTCLLRYPPPECVAAWKVVAEECCETVEHCTWRWKVMRKSFQRAMRRNSNTKYYLHEHMEFLIPHLSGYEYEQDDKISEETNSDIKSFNMDDSSPQDDENITEETTTDRNLINTDTIVVEEDENTKEKECTNKDKQKKYGFDSDTTSADESHIAMLQKLTNTANSTHTNKVGEFIIKDINAVTSNGKEGDGKQMDVPLNASTVDVTEDVVSLISEEDREENTSGRSRYKRACKRGLNAEMVSELTIENQEQKRPRRSVERRQTLAGIALEEFSKRKSLTNLTTKKSEVKIPKLKSNKNTSLKVQHFEQQPINMEASVKDIPAHQDTSVNGSTPVIVAVTGNTTNVQDAVQNIDQMLPIETPTNIFHQQTINQMTYYKQPQMIDTSTITDFETRNSSTQYELQQQDALDFDDIFINSIKPQLQLMNGRQKMNFKRKVFQSLMEVFDDASNFPNTDEYIVLPPSGAPRFDNTTNGELRLMRELVSLVQAAKTTPEIINDTEKVTTPTKPILEKPSTPQMPQVKPLPKNAHIMMSPTLDDEDFRFTTEPVNDDDDDASLPRSLDEILCRRDDDDVLGLPRRVIHKVVKVGGPNGSTIVAGEAGKRRVYRIYPKSANIAKPNQVGQSNSAGNTGTFYATASKGNVTTQQINQHNANKSNGSNATKTFKAVHKTANNVFITPTSSNVYNKSQTITPTSSNVYNKSQTITMSVNKTPTSSSNTITPYLDQATGLFVHSNNAASKTPTNNNNNNKPISTPKISPNSGNLHSAAKAAPQCLIVKSVVAGKLVPTQSALMQRRYSICGTAPLRNSPLPSVPKPIIQKPTVSSNDNTVKSAPTQIQISQAVSLNANANSQIFPTNITKSFSNNRSNSTVTSNTTPSIKFKVTTSSTPISSNNKTLEQSSSKPSPLNQETRIADKPQRPREIPVIETAGTIAADIFADPLFVDPLIKNEPLD